ncbi:MAG: 3-oxoacyl-ACP synthase [Ignavibacteriaceae bacterium]|nr:MAG: ketoacyl-ACP synthase III [Chlorobiota bacterium]GJQ32654.1 MAG: 3-oxoacyl-ACP synthase [Ignavibacteriaceae bacterium]
MAFATLNNVKISAMAAAVPSNRESNFDLPFDPEVNRKLVTTTGIENRHVAPEGMCASDLCFAAADKLLNDNNIDRSSIDLLIFNSQTPDYKIPYTSGHLQHRLGLSTDTMCFDMTMGCSGYVYALFVAGSMLETGQLRRALVLAGDVLTPEVSRFDRSASPLFGDAGSATLLEFEEGNISKWGLNTDGSGYNSLIVEAGGGRKSTTEESLIYKEYGTDIKRRETDVNISGMDIFNFSISLVPKVINAFIDHFAIKKDEIDLWLLHQANLIINNILAKKLEIPAGKMPLSLHEFGNTSSVSIPLTAVTKGKFEIEKGASRVFMSGFGTGLSCASCVLDLAGVKFSELVFVDQ